MGYRIVYGKGPDVTCGKEVRRTRLRSMVACGLLAFSLLVKCFWPEGAVELREALLPGEMTKTQQAFQTLFVNIKDGEPLSDALTAFCVEIIEIERIY